MTFHELYERYAADVYRFAYWLAGSSADAEDITSETMIRAWVGSNRQIRTETVKAYLFTIARNLYLKQQKEAQRTIPLESFQADLGAGPERIAAGRQELDKILAAIQDLPEVDRSALLLRTLYDLPYAEIARILAISLSTAKVKVHRARLKLAVARSDSEVN